MAVDSSMSAGLDEAVVIVTGGSLGIGKACARLFALSGAHVVIVARRMSRARAAAQDIESVSRHAVDIIQADVGVPSQCEELVARVRKFHGRLDVLVNCAAYFKAMAAIDVAENAWHRTLDTNAQGIFFCSQAFAQVLIADRRAGTIVNISSTSSKLSSPDRAPYAASKASVDSLTRSFALELAPHRIRVNAVAPGHTNTESIRDALAHGYLSANAITRVIPLHRLAEPDEVAELVVFLCSSHAAIITGQTIYADGGRTAYAGHGHLHA